MKTKFAVALMKNGDESILAVFNTMEEADIFGRSNPFPKDAGLEYCFSCPFLKGKPHGNSIRVHSYYNASEA